MNMLTTVEGQNVTVRVSGSTILINSAKVILADNDASNGVIHIIDAVLQEPNPRKFNHLWFRGWIGGVYNRRCGEVDAGPRMPDAIFDPSNAASLKAYEDLTIALFGFDVFHRKTVVLELGRCATNNFTTPTGQKTIDWTGVNMMDGICQWKCDCNFRGANKTVPDLPTCTDEPDDPKAAKWCSLCGPKYNKNIKIDVFKCNVPGVIREVCPGPLPSSRSKSREQVLKDLFGQL